MKLEKLKIGTKIIDLAGFVYEVKEHYYLGSGKFMKYQYTILFCSEWRYRKELRLEEMKTAKIYK